MIPVKEGSDFNQLGQTSLAHFQTRWRKPNFSSWMRSLWLVDHKLDEWTAIYIRPVLKIQDEILGGNANYILW